MKRTRRNRLKYAEQSIISKHISEHKGIYFFILIIFTMGFIIGSIKSVFIDETLKNESHNYILNFVEYLKTQEIDNKILIKESLSANIKPVIYITLFGLILVGAPLILVYIGLYGYSVGFTITSIMSSLGKTSGIAFILTMMIPQEVVLLLTIFILAVNAILFSKTMLKMNSRNTNIRAESLKYISICVIAAIISVGVSMFETYIGSSLAKTVIQLIT